MCHAYLPKKAEHPVNCHVFDSTENMLLMSFYKSNKSKADYLFLC
ncbi:hypothetical protein SAMN04515625_1970 [Methanohalophilus halophilus]|uniref:Uncharacterized protein n=1 Tax=Methanohalophilus halophilus TaxID=2177 RepID=A0A1H2XVQ3_9EURY|nr:hypothetical protein SAMN04515625_1970 [Methanohalophilus halophilus]